MAGQDVSANLGGMLSQIGGAFAGAGQMGQGLMRPITMAFRPQLDANDVQSLQNQAAFYGRIGDTAQQRMFTEQALVLEERNREEAEKQRKLEEGQARATAVSEYGRAVLSGDKNSIDLALEKANKVFQDQGIVARPFLDAEENSVFTAKRREEMAADRKFELEERQRATDDRAALDTLATNLLNANSVEAADEAIKNVPDSIAARASQLRDAAVNRINTRTDRARSEAALKAPLDTISTDLLPEEADIAPELRAGFSKAIESFNERIEKLNQDIADGKAIYPGQKQQLQQQRAALEARIYRETDGAINRKYATEQAEQKLFDRGTQKILFNSYSSAEVKAAQEVPGFNLDYDEAVRRLKNRDLALHFKLAGKEVPPELVQYKPGDPRSVLVGLAIPSGPDRSAFEVVSSEPASAEAVAAASREDTLLARRAELLSSVDRKGQRDPALQEELSVINAELGEIRASRATGQMGRRTRPAGVTSSLGMPEADFYSGGMETDPFIKYVEEQSKNVTGGRRRQQ
jgi:hypothetical protein